MYFMSLQLKIYEDTLRYRAMDFILNFLKKTTTFPTAVQKFRTDDSTIITFPVSEVNTLFLASYDPNTSDFTSDSVISLLPSIINRSTTFRSSRIFPVQSYS